MTNLIRETDETLQTRGEWLIDDNHMLLNREMAREGRGGKLIKFNNPTISESTNRNAPPEEQNIPLDRHNQSSEVFEKFGILPLVNRYYDPYDVMSLFTLMPHDFLYFLNWSKSSEMIDIIFGIYLTNVINAIENRQEKEANITDAMSKAPSTLEMKETELKQAQRDLEELKATRESLHRKLSNKSQRLDALREESDVEERVNRLRSELSALQSHLADLKTQQAEKVSELGAKQNSIQRYEDTELVDDVGGIGDELASLMTVPDRCPVCTNAVDGNQRERLIHDEKCPLCAKEVDDDLLTVEKEYQADDSLFDRREEQREELDELYAERDGLEFQIEELEGEIESTKTEIESIKNTIDEQEFTEVIEQRSNLEQEIRNLRKEAVDIDVQIEGKKDEIKRLNYEVKANEHLSELLDERREMESALKSFHSIVLSVRRDQRRELKARLRTEIEENLLPIFDSGMFADAQGLSFDDEENYHFTLYAPSQRFKSSRAQSEAAESTLHALLFHTAILRLLAEEDNTPPIEMLVIDSPLTNDMDANNKSDVVDLIESLPDYLEKYQLIISMANSDTNLVERLREIDIPMKEFEKKVEESDEDQTIEFGNEDRGVA